MTDDAELLRQYAESGSETAFAELVGRESMRRSGEESTMRLTEDDRLERTAALLYGPNPQHGGESRKAGHEHGGSGGLPRGSGPPGDLPDTNRARGLGNRNAAASPACLSSASASECPLNKRLCLCVNVPNILLIAQECQHRCL
jgi:hypothetical protein